MICADARELMFEADTDAMAGLGGSPLAAHIQSCSECRGVAAGLVAEVRLAKAALRATQPGIIAAGVAQRAMSAVNDARPVTDLSRRTGLRRVRRYGLPMIALAAAAIVLFVIDERPVVSRSPLPATVSPDSSASSIAVEVPEGKNAIVFETNNPMVSVVWIY